jgi:hypothetical protein
VQEQYPQSRSEELTPAERQALRRVRTRRVQGLLAGVGTGVLVLFAVGCPEPADLQNPGSYPTPPSTGTTGGTGGTGTTMNCEVQCVNDIFQKELTLCKLCHGAALKSSMLDLEAPGYTARLKNVPAVHGDLATGMTKADCPTGDKLIDTANPANSWLLKKIRNEQGQCGTVMPSTGTLSAAQKTCLETYVACVAGGSVGAGGTGTGGAGTGGTGTGGGGATSGGTASGGGGATSGGGGSGGTGTGGGGTSAGGGGRGGGGNGGTGGT